MSKNFKITGLFLVAVAMLQIQLISADRTPVRKCSDDQPLPLWVQLDSCTELPCDVSRGKTSNMDVQFVSPRNNLTEIKADVRFTTLGIGMPFELDAERRNVCKNLMFGAYCPLDKGEDVTYHLVLDIGAHHPEVPAKIEVSLQDSITQEELTCFIVDIRIKKHMGGRMN